MPKKLPDQNIIRGEAARRDLKRFIKDFWTVLEPTIPFQDGYQIDALVDHLSNMKQIRNLLINMPPRVGKSSLLCLFFGWFWASHPATRFVCTSYSLQLATRDSLACRAIIQSKLYQDYYGHVFTMSDDQNTKTRFQNDKTGFRLANSIDGSTTGEGGEFIIADDPHNVKEADSKANRDAVIDWYKNVWFNRLNDPVNGCRLLVMQRVHGEDVSNYIIKNDVGQDWTKLILPVEAGRSKYVSSRYIDPRLPGELLCPARIPPQQIEMLKSTMGKRSFDAQYNQNPALNDNALFDPNNIKYYEPEQLPPDGMTIVAIDLAISTTGDYTVMVVADIYRDGAIYVKHMVRDRMPGTRLVPTIKVINEAYKPTVIYIEDVAFQRIIIQEARTQGLPVRGVKPEGDKISRSVMLQVKVEQGLLHLPKNGKHNEDILDEMAEFPGSAHDDIIDALSYLALEANNLYRRMPERRTELTKEEAFQTEQEDFLKRVKEDQARLANAFFQGLN